MQSTDRLNFFNMYIHVTEIHLDDLANGHAGFFPLTGPGHTTEMIPGSGNVPQEFS
jgi:hypothetical protein